MTSRQRGWLLPPFAVLLAAGILLGRAADSWIFGAAGCALALCAVLLTRGAGRFFACLALALSLGCLRGYFGFHPSLPAEGTYQVSGVVSAEVESRENGQFRTQLSGVTLDGAPLSAGAYWSFYAGELPAGLAPGQRVDFQARLYHPSGASNPDGYDFREELLRRGITVGLYGAEDLVVSPPSSFSLSGAAASLRHRLTRALVASPLGEEAGGYAAAMLLGNRSLLPREDRTAFSRLGIAHVLSVSGFHVGLLIGFLAALFRALRLPQRFRLVLYAVLLGAYALLCGGGQPVIRASLLLLLSLEGRILNRPRGLTHLLCAAWVLMLLWSPVQLTGLSFQLSFGAVFGIALITPYLSSLWRPKHRLTRGLRTSLTAGLGAQIGILLPELYAFQEFPLLGLIMNIPVLFLSSVLIGVYWLALVTLPVPFLSAPVCAAGRWLTSALLSGVRYLGQLPGITLWTKAPSLLSVPGFLLLAAALCVLPHWKGRTRLALLGPGLLVLALSLTPLPFAGTEYLQFSVGSADAALLRDRDTVIAFDTGYTDGALSDYLHRHRLTPTAVVLTHLHSDHVRGLEALREDHIPVPLIYIPEGAESADVHPDVLLLLDSFRREGTEIRTLAAGDRIALPSGEITVLWPESGKVRPGQDANESSLVALLNLKGATLLQTGDLDGRYEMYAAAPADLLKAPHHGSASSSSPAFLASVSPEAVLLSCGDTDRTLQYRERLDPAVPLYSTADQGMLTVRFEEDGFTVETFH